MGKLTWSYSSIKLFDQCPKKYYHLRVAKDVQDGESEAMLYGNQMHKAAELYIKKSEPLPGAFVHLKPVLDKVVEMPGEKHCEIKMGVTADLAACGFFDKQVWLRTIADVVVIDDDRAFVIDWKTSKNANYADIKQLDLVAGAVFTHYPQVKKVKSALAFVVSNDFIKKDQHGELRKSYLATFEPQLERLAVAQETGVWNANASPLCGWCPVTSCPNHRIR